MKIANRKIIVNGIKWILDGTPCERGAAMLQPYADAPNERGRLNFTEVEIAKLLRESVTFRQPILFHAVGDRTVEAILSAVELSFKFNRLSDLEIVFCFFIIFSFSCLSVRPVIEYGATLFEFWDNMQ